MNLLDRRVDAALRDRPALETLRPVVEKELLHHDILRVMSHMGHLRGHPAYWEYAVRRLKDILADEIIG